MSLESPHPLSRRLWLIMAGTYAFSSILPAEAASKIPAKPLQLKVNRARWKRIIIHHSATHFGNTAKFDREHRRRGMENGMAYHFLIGNGVDIRDGAIETGPRWRKQLQGGHVESFQLNEESIGICLLGNFQKKAPSLKQIQALQQLTLRLATQVLNKRLTICLHRDLERTLCPGKYFPEREFDRFLKTKKLA